PESRALGAGLQAFGPADGRRRAAAVAERLGLAEAARAYTVTYSLGMKKRLALALALLHDPKVLIMDEPTNGLDPAGARQMRETISELAAGGRPIFLAAHPVGAPARLGPPVGVRQDGR